MRSQPNYWVGFFCKYIPFENAYIFKLYAFMRVFTSIYRENMRKICMSRINMQSLHYEN